MLKKIDAGWRPDSDDLAKAEVLTFWQVRAAGHGPYLLQGALQGKPYDLPLLAIDLREGWAVTHDDVLVLGERAPEACMSLSAEDVRLRAVKPATDDRRAIRAALLALLERARRSGLTAAAHFLELALAETNP